MGCDIHLYTERKTDDGWFNCDNWRLNRHYSSNPEDYESKYNISSIYDNRNYRLFSILADVRNNHDNKYISEAKGLPKDISLHVKKESDEWEIDGHSHSFFTLRELREFQKENKTVKYAGLMSKEDADLVDKGEMPNTWCQGSSNSDLIYKEWSRDEDALISIIDPLDERMRDEFWIWDDNEHPDIEEKIRIVFWFDN